MTKFIVQFSADSIPLDVSQFHVFHNQEDMKAWLNNSGHFHNVHLHDEGGTFTVKHGGWKGSFSIDKAESHL